MYEERAIFAGCIYVFHQLATTVRPGLTGKGDSLLYKTVKNLHVAEGSDFCPTDGQQYHRQLFSLCFHDPITLHCNPDNLQPVLQCDKG